MIMMKDEMVISMFINSAVDATMAETISITHFDDATFHFSTEQHILSVVQVGDALINNSY